MAEGPIFGVDQEPLYLTPYLESGQLSEARELSKVIFNSEHYGYSGFLTVNKENETNMFFWFDPSVNNPTAPVIVVFNSKYGETILKIAIQEIGPFSVHRNGELEQRELRWNKHFNMLYMDAVIGGGFSFSKSDDYAQSPEDIADYIYEALRQFFEIFFNGWNTELYFMTREGSSLFALPLAKHFIDDNITNFTGLLLGNPVFIPKVQWTNYSSYLFQLNLIDNRQRETFEKQEANCRKTYDLLDDPESHLTLIDFITCISILNPTLVQLTLFGQITGYKSVDNVLRSHECRLENQNFENWIARNETRQAYHVGSIPLQRNNFALIENLGVSVFRSKIEYLNFVLDNGIRVMSMLGHLDIQTPIGNYYTLLDYLNFTTLPEFIQVPTRPWHLNGYVAGNIKEFANFKHLTIYGSGQRLSYDQPIRALTAVRDYVFQSN